MKKSILISVMIMMVFIFGEESFALGSCYTMDDFLYYQTQGQTIYFKDLKEVQELDSYTSLSTIKNFGEVGNGIYEQEWGFNIINFGTTENARYTIGFHRQCLTTSIYPHIPGCYFPVIIEDYRLTDLITENYASISFQLENQLPAGEWKLSSFGHPPQSRVFSYGEFCKSLRVKSKIEWGHDLIKTTQQLNRFVNDQPDTLPGSPVTIETGILKQISNVKNEFLDNTKTVWSGSILLLEQREFNDRIPESEGYTQILYWLKRRVGIVRIEIWDHFYNSDQPQLQMAVGAYKIEKR